MAANAVAFRALGFASAAVPLASLHTSAPAGCDLLVQALDVALLLPAGGRVTAKLAIPGDPVFVGAVLRQQVVVAELVAGDISLLVGSNGLEATIGMF